ncbi:MFS transporter [Terrihabitans soli]|uniref:MFS transporter n=1 Tax=Terrihabitans soli TaxID=708113 RepID=A0A6S6QWS0_9HYPH|nr:MFS transporter [Terrihabitans soli]BCJ90978.1 MFS transporter [Terrihabitans soli]
MRTAAVSQRKISAAKAVYYRLLAGQVLALLGTGIATVGLALLAYDLAGDNAGAVLGTALSIKMMAYVVVTPLASVFAERLPRRATLVALDLIRAGVALSLPFVTRVWEIYLLIFVFQAASATFTPVFQALIPDLLQDRREYARALSLSRLAVELENVASPLIAGLLLLFVSLFGLFVSAVAGFLLSAAIIVWLNLPEATHRVRGGRWQRAAHGLRMFLAVPRLRGLTALNIAVAAATAMVIVNTVVIVQGEFGLNERAVAFALTVFGAGSVTGALLFISLIERADDRLMMMAGGLVAGAGLFAGLGVSGFVALQPVWFFLGVGCALAQTPAGVLICRSSREGDRHLLYATQFALFHLCLLAAYPLAGWIGAEISVAAAFTTLGLIAAFSVILALRLWPPGDGLVPAAQNTDRRTR